VTLFVLRLIVVYYVYNTTVDIIKFGINRWVRVLKMNCVRPTICTVLILKGLPQISWA